MAKTYYYEDGTEINLGDQVERPITNKLLIPQHGTKAYGKIIKVAGALAVKLLTSGKGGTFAYAPATRLGTIADASNMVFNLKKR